MKNFIDGLLGADDFKVVVQGSETQFYTNEDDCLLYKFLKNVQEADDVDVRLNEYKYIINESNLLCFFSNSGATSYLKNAIYRLESDKHSVLKSFLHYMTIKIIESSLLSSLINDRDLDKLIIALKSVVDAKELKDFKEYYIIKNIAQQSDTDVLLKAIYDEVAYKSYNEMKNPDIVASIYYKFQYNKYLRYYRVWEYIVQAKYIVTKDLNVENLRYLKVIDSKMNDYFSLTDSTIKLAVSKTGSKFTGTEEFLNRAKGGYKIFSGYEDLDLILNNSVETTTYSELLGNPYVVKNVLRNLDYYLESIVKPQYGEPNANGNNSDPDGLFPSSEVFNAKDMIKNPIIFADGNNLLNDAKTSMVDSDDDALNKSIDILNNITMEDIINNPNQVDDATFVIRELVNNTTKSATDTGSALYYGSDKTSSSDALSHNSKTMNDDYLSSLDLLQNLLNKNRQQADFSIGALGGLQAKITMWMLAFSAFMALLQSILDIISALLNLLKQLICLITSILCFLKTLKQRLILTGEEILKAYNSIMESIEKVKTLIANMWTKFRANFETVVDAEILSQVQAIVKPKVLPLAMLVDNARYAQVQAALDQAIIDTIKEGSAGRNVIYASIIDGIISNVKAVKDSLYASFAEAFDTNRCKVKPLFEIPDMLSFNIEGLIFRNSFSSGLSFTTTNCKV